MSNVSDFKPRAELEAAKQLDGFITWAKDSLPKGIPDLVHEGIQWDMLSWHQLGVHYASFRAYDASRYSSDGVGVFMKPPFIDFAKSMIVHARVFRRKKYISDLLGALKALEAALVDLKGTRDVTQVSAAVCSRACEFIVARCPKGRGARDRSLQLENTIKFMEKKGLLANPFKWRTPVAPIQVLGNLKQQKQNSEKRLPSRESLKALGELFNNDLFKPIDIVVTSACALLLSQPSRVGELADVEYDPIVFKEGANGCQRMFLRWYAEKGFGATLKPVVTGMEPVIERLIERVYLSLKRPVNMWLGWKIILMNFLRIREYQIKG
jgi:hypothetical protein